MSAIYFEMIQQQIYVTNNKAKLANYFKVGLSG